MYVEKLQFVFTKSWTYILVFWAGESIVKDLLAHDTSVEVGASPRSIASDHRLQRTK